MAVTEWQTFLRSCLLKRTSVEEFAKLLQQKSHLNGKGTVFALLDCRHAFCAQEDPLPPLYLDLLLSSQIVTPSDILIAAISRWNKQKKSNTSDTLCLQELAWLVMSPKLQVDRHEIIICLTLSAKWLTAIVQYLSQDTSPDAHLIQLTETVGSLLATFSGTSLGIEILSHKRAERTEQGDVLSTVGKAVDAALTTIPALSEQLMRRLEVVQKHLAAVNIHDAEADPNQQADFESSRFKASLPILQMTASRSGTVLYLQSMLFAAKTIDDQVLFTFLEGRHNSNYASMFSDLLLASFQTLKTASNLGQPFFDHTQVFIRDKLPTVLLSISPFLFTPNTSISILSDVWSHIQPDLATPELLISGQRFLHVCFLAGLIPQPTRDTLLDYDKDAVAKSFKRPLTKDDVVAQVNNGQLRLNDLVDQLLDLDGSTAALAQAIVEIIMTYASNKEPHHLKDVAHALVRRPGAINALAMFIRPSYWLTPLCSLLDEWRWDEIHGESQPLYDEFGSILLCIIISKRRLSLKKGELGINDSGGFVSRYFDQEGTEHTLQDLSEQSQKHLGEWIKALYIDDGINDELTTSCSPQEFYLFLPTLLRQSLLAMQSGKLGKDALKSGLEFLSEPFLLPSVVSALSWIYKSSDADARTFILPALTKSPSAEAKIIHQTIMKMVESTGTFVFDMKANAKLGDLRQEVTVAIQGQEVPAQLAADTRLHCQVVGYEQVLKTLVDVLVDAVNTTVFLSALDVTSTLICTADHQLRDLLKLEFATLKTLLEQKQNSHAEVITHLCRRVEAYAGVLMTPELQMEQFATLNLSNMNAVAASMEVSAAPAQEMQQVEEPMDDIDQVLNESVAMNSLEQIDTNTLTMDDYYGLQGDMGNLEDLDLEMFS